MPINEFFKRDFKRLNHSVENVKLPA